MRPQEIFENNKFRSKPRSKSPKHNELAPYKVVSFYTDSENQTHPMAEHESEIQMKRFNFDTSSEEDSSEPDLDDESNDGQWNRVLGKFIIQKLN